MQHFLCKGILSSIFFSPNVKIMVGDSVNQLKHFPGLMIIKQTQMLAHRGTEVTGTIKQEYQPSRACELDSLNMVETDETARPGNPPAPLI